jgi:hypothetical protein
MQPSHWSLTACGAFERVFSAALVEETLSLLYKNKIP